SGKVGLKERLGLVPDMALEALDTLVFRRPRALAVGVPALLPEPALLLARSWPQLAGSPAQRLSRQPADHRPKAPERHVCLIDAHAQLRPVRLARPLAVVVLAPLHLLILVLASGFCQRQREVVAGGLLCCDDQRVQVR